MRDKLVLCEVVFPEIHRWPHSPQSCDSLLSSDGVMKESPSPINSLAFDCGRHRDWVAVGRHSINNSRRGISAMYLNRCTRLHISQLRNIFEGNLRDISEEKEDFRRLLPYKLVKEGANVVGGECILADGRSLRNFVSAQREANSRFAISGASSGVTGAKPRNLAGVQGCVVDYVEISASSDIRREPIVGIKNLEPISRENLRVVGQLFSKGRKSAPEFICT